MVVYLLVLQMVKQSKINGDFMKVEVIKNKFPILMIYKDDIENENALIVLFKNDKIGTVIQKDISSTWNIGDYSENWCIDLFVPFNGRIVLSN